MILCNVVFFSLEFLRNMSNLIRDYLINNINIFLSILNNFNQLIASIKKGLPELRSMPFVKLLTILAKKKFAITLP